MTPYVTNFKIKTNIFFAFFVVFQYDRVPEEHDRTCSDGCCVSEVRIHLVLARLSLALLWQAMHSAAYAERNQEPCQWAARHFQTKCKKNEWKGGITKKNNKKKTLYEAGAGKLWSCVWRDPGCLLAAGAPGWGVGAHWFYAKSIGEGGRREWQSKGEERRGEGIYWRSPTRRVSNIDTQLLTSQKQRRLISDWLENMRCIFENARSLKENICRKKPKLAALHIVVTKQTLTHLELWPQMQWNKWNLCGVDFNQLFFVIY